MFNMVDRFKRSQADAATTEAALATTEAALALSSLADPEHVQRELAAVESQIRADDVEWERLDRTSNPHAFTQQQEIANRRGRLEAERDGLRRRLAKAESSRAAFVTLVEFVRAMDRQITEECRRLYSDFLLLATDDRRKRLESLDGLVRLRARIAAPVAGVCPAREFRRGANPLAALADDLRAAADQIDRHTAPGMRRTTLAPPEGVSELIAALNDGRSA